jgi:nitrogen regulatory protein PII
MATSVSSEIQMSMVVAYIYEQAFEPIRAELLALSFDSLAITAVNCSAQGVATTVHYRGTTLTNHLRTKFKLECVVAVEDVSTIVDTVLKYARDVCDSEDPVFVVPIEAYRLEARESAAVPVNADYAALA